VSRGDEEVGVYGFMFHRDGEWISVVVDNELYLRRPEFENRLHKEEYVGFIILWQIYGNSGNIS